MLQSLIGVFNDFNTILSQYAIILQTAEQIKTKNSAIGQTHMLLTADGTATTSEKREVKEKMAVLSGELAAAGAAYAADKGLLVLEKTLHVSYSDVRYGTDAEAIALAEMIHSELSGIAIAELQEYLVTQEDLDELDGLTGSFDTASEQKGSVKSQRVAATKQLALLFDEMDTLLEKCDRLLKRIQRKEPEFYNTYANARMVVGK